VNLILQNASSEIASYFITGNIRAFIPGRVSFCFEWEGPSNSIDSGDTSALVALEHAAHALRAGQCDTALAGAVTVVTQPQVFIGMQTDGLLSSSTTNNATFDASNDGAVRGDGCGVLVLKRLSDARRENDNIIATLPAFASAYPSSKAPGEVWDRLRSQVGDEELANIAYVEASGHHTPEGEARELDTIAKSLASPGHRRERPLYVGSLRPNIGASEAVCVCLPASQVPFVDVGSLGVRNCRRNQSCAYASELSHPASYRHQETA
jgi:acyl transferase domain-containing protein